jgi:hypothetical protein
VTPVAVQGAAFEKDRGPNAGPVVNGVFLDIEDRPLHILRQDLQDFLDYFFHPLS